MLVRFICALLHHQNTQFKVWKIRFKKLISGLGGMAQVIEHLPKKKKKNIKVNSSWILEKELVLTKSVNETHKVLFKGTSNF
jgi:hypothetical protein